MTPQFLRVHHGESTLHCRNWSSSLAWLCLVGLNQFAIVSGMLLVYPVNYQIARQVGAEWNGAFGWRWMFGSGALPAGVQFACLFFIPEIPRFLALKGRGAEALAIAARIDDSLPLDFESQTLDTPGNQGIVLAVCKKSPVSMFSSTMRRGSSPNWEAAQIPRCFKR